MRRERIPELDGYRVLFVVLVSVYHFWQQSWLRPGLFGADLDFLARAGYVFVDPTILLSGFLLFLPWVRGGGVPEAPGRFLRRRLARVWPSLAFVTLFMLFADALPRDLYGEAWRPPLWRDVVSHLTFTFPFFRDTYQNTPLGGASWTVAVEMHFYLLFPFLARAAKKRPGAVLGGMCAAAAYFRLWCLWTQRTYDMVVNQMANFLDVYALGMACALLWPRLTALRERFASESPGRRLALQGAATAAGVKCAALFLQLLRRQASMSEMEDLQASQMILRPLFALCAAGMLLTLPLALRPVRKLFGNPVTRFLAGISMNYYLLHANIATLLKTPAVRAWLETPRDWLGGKRILYSPYEFPNYEGDHRWQVGYVVLCVVLSVLGAALVTYAVEKPLGRLIMGKRRKEPPVEGISGGSDAV